MEKAKKIDTMCIIMKYFILERVEHIIMPSMDADRCFSLVNSMILQKTVKIIVKTLASSAKTNIKQGLKKRFVSLDFRCYKTYKNFEG